MRLSEKNPPFWNVDRSLRRAIHLCWKTLPAGEQTPENVERKIQELLTRALEDLKQNTPLESAPFPELSKRDHEAWLAEIRSKYPKAYDPWTPEEDALLRQKFSENVPVKELTSVFERKPSAIRSRLKRLGLIPL